MDDLTLLFEQLQVLIEQERFEELESHNSLVGVTDSRLQFR